MDLGGDRCCDVMSVFFKYSTPNGAAGNVMLDTGMLGGEFPPASVALTRYQKVVPADSEVLASDVLLVVSAVVHPSRPFGDVSTR